MATSGKGGFRNNGQPRVTLPRGVTRVAQLKAALRELRGLQAPTRAEIERICCAALEGTYVKR